MTKAPQGSFLETEGYSSDPWDIQGGYRRATKSPKGYPRYPEVNFSPRYSLGISAPGFPRKSSPRGVKGRDEGVSPGLIQGLLPGLIPGTLGGTREHPRAYTG